MPSRKRFTAICLTPSPVSLHPNRNCTMTIGLPHSPNIFSECLFTTLTCPCVLDAAWPGRIIRLQSCRTCPSSRVKKSPRPKGRLKCQERDFSCPHIRLTYRPEALRKITSPSAAVLLPHPHSATTTATKSQQSETSIRGPDPIEKRHQSLHRPRPEAVNPHDHSNHPQGQPRHHDAEHADRSDGRPQRKPAAHAEGAAEPELVEPDRSGRGQADPRDAALQQLASPQARCLGVGGGGGGSLDRNRRSRCAGRGAAN